VSGGCDPPTFLGAVDALVQSSGDEAWEVLSLLDQYYRRGKLPLDQFRSLKAHVDRIALASTQDVAISAAADPPPANAAHQAIAIASNDAALWDASRIKLATSDVPVAPSEVRIAVADIPADAPAASVAGAPPPGAAPGGALSVGSVLRGRYKLVGVLGKGGMGTVFEAVDCFRVDLPQVPHRLAVKVMHTVVTGRPELFDELRSEFQHLQSLSHPNIVRVHEFDRDGETAFFTMELLSGAPLSRLFGTRQDAAIARPYALAMIRDIGAAVAHAHSRNIVHGDLNPQNIFVTEAGEVRVLDFGAAHKMKRGPWVSDFETEQQTPAATPAFGSCQVLEGETPDVRDDVFAFACVIYMLLTGRHPFQSRTAIEARSLRLVPARPIGLTPRQWRWLRAGLAFERERRPLDVERWLQDLRLRGAATRLPTLADLTNEPPQRDYSNVYLALVLGLVAIAGMALWSKTKRDAPVAISSAPIASDQHAAASEPEATATATAETPVHKPLPHDTPPTRATAERIAPPSVAMPGASSPGAALASAAPSTVVPTTSVAASDSAATRPTAPRSRIELTAATVEVMPGESTARVTLRRKGSLRGSVSFTWWTEPGTAKSGVDFAASTPHLETMGNGQSLDTLLIPIVSNPRRHEERSFYFVIDDAGPDAGAAVIGRTTAMITILPQD
jgi:serine/threonine protein kinase